MPDLSYAGLLALALVRVGLVAVVSFVVLTRFTLPGTREGGRAWGDVILGLSTTLVLATLLGLLGLFDTASLAAALGLALAGGAVLRYRRLWRRTLLQQYATVLHWVERVVPPDPVVAGLGERGTLPPVDLRAEVRAWLGARWRSVTELSAQTGWWVGVGVAAAVALGVRLIPTLAEAAPFTLRHYASLETLKSLVEGAPVGSPDGWGLHALVMALSEMARVDPALVLRGVGAVSAAAMVYGVYQTARFYWSGRTGAFVGALFLAAGGPLLPLPLSRQAGAEPLMLAAALALAVFPHLAAYIGSGSRRGATVGGLGLLATGLVYPAVGALLATIVALYVATIVVQVARRGAEPAGRTSRYRNRGLRRRVIVMGAAGTATAALWWGYVGLLDGVSANASIFFFEAARSNGWGGAPTVLAAILGTLAVAAPYVPGRERFESRLPRPGALIRTGGQTLGVLALWIATGATYEGVSGAAAVLLMTAVGVDLALVVNEIVYRVAPAWSVHETSAEPGTVVAWVPAVIALGVGLGVIWTGWAVPVPGPGVEPGGFVRAYHAIDREAQPYAWTAVSHLGTGVLVRHRGRFMDYAYFLAHYDAARYDHRGDDAIPTPDLFVFVERDPLRSRVEDELMPAGPNLPARVRDWLAAYADRPDQAPNVSVFYRDADVEVIRISRPAPTLLQLEPESDLAEARRPAAPGPQAPAHAP